MKLKCLLICPHVYALALESPGYIMVLIVPSDYLQVKQKLNEYIEKFIQRVHWIRMPFNRNVFGFISYLREDEKYLYTKKI